MKNRLHSWLSKLGTQMTAIVVVLFITTVVSLSLSSRAAMEAELLEVTQRYTVQVLDQVIKNVEYYIGDMENIAEISNKQSEILSMLFEEGNAEFSRSTFYSKSQVVQQLLRGISTMRGELANIIIVGENGTVSDIRNNYYTIVYSNLVNTDWYRAAIDANGKPVYNPPYIQQYTLDRNITVISIAKSISMYEGGEALGVILIELNLQALSHICSNVTLHESGYIFIVDKDGNYIYHPENRYLFREWSLPESDAEFEDDDASNRILNGETSFMTGKGAARRYVTSRRLDGTQWYVVGVVPYNEIYASSASVGNTQLAFGIFAALAVACLIAFLLSRMVFLPIERLRLVMGKVEKGDLDAEAPVTADNEIGEFSRGFNNMTRKLKRLMETLVSNEKSKRKAELAALHAQINPHFLYNTLDAIVWMAEFNPPAAAEMAGQLAKLFRLALGKGSDVVTVAQELEYVEHYLTIQKMRYKTKFEYRIEYEPEVANAPLPKLVVQVLVENAIYHGIKPKRQKCFLLVRVFKECGEVVVQVVDDGVGMTRESIERIFSGSYKSERSWGGVGVKNVRERLTLYFSENVRLEYDSIYGTGTIAEIRMPAGVEPVPENDAEQSV